MLEKLEMPQYPQLAEDFKALLNRFRLKELTEEQFDVELCETTCKHPECIGDFAFRNPPSKTPDVAKWKFLKEDEKKALLKADPEYYRDNILKHYEQATWVENINTRNKAQLRAWLKCDISEPAKLSVQSVLRTHAL